MSAELIKLLTEARETVKQALAAKLAEVDECRKDLADLDEHIERQRAKDRKQAAAEPPTEVWPPVPPRDPQQNGAAVLGQAPPAVFRDQAVYVDRSGAQWDLRPGLSDPNGDVWQWTGEVVASSLGDGEVPVMKRTLRIGASGGPVGEEMRFDALVERVGLRATDNSPAPADTVTDPPAPEDGA